MIAQGKAVGRTASVARGVRTHGPQKVRVCDGCRTVCCPGRYCSGRCAREDWERRQREREAKEKGGRP